MHSSNQIQSLAIVTPFYPPHVGGVERYSQEFARAALAMGLSVNIVTTDAVRKAQESVEDGGIRVLRLPAYNLPMMGSHYPITLQAWSHASEMLRCDVVIAQTRFFMTTLMAARIAAGNKARFFVVDHGAGPLRNSPKALALASLWYERAVTARLKRRSVHFLGVSRASVEWLRTFGIRDATVLPNGIAAPLTMPMRDAAGFVKPVVFFAGRLLPEKGIAELVEAIDLLGREGTNVALRIAGDGPMAGFLEKHMRSAGFLTYLGRLPHDQITAELRNASIFVNPSNLPEGFPTVLLEAGAAALPVVSTVGGGSADLIREGETGFVIPVGAAPDIAARIREILARPAEALRRGSELFRLVQAQYTWPSIVRDFLRYAEGGAAA
ncbi:MAG TPA: glycosyltransferase family 4 protein [Candidatus Cybelea sp.]